MPQADAEDGQVRSLLHNFPEAIHGCFTPECDDPVACHSDGLFLSSALLRIARTIADEKAIETPPNASIYARVRRTTVIISQPSASYLTNYTEV